MIKTIAMVTTGLTFNGNSVYEKALGGSESAMIYMAKELAALGNVVHVYCECDKPGLYAGVVYHHISSWHNETNRPMNYDVAIMSRFIEMTPSYDFSKMTVFWMHDMFEDKFRSYSFLADKVFLMSDYQAKIYGRENVGYPEMIYQTKNGFDDKLASAKIIKPLKRRKNNYVFLSRPERGLEYLITRLWDGIREINPEAKLHVCSYLNPAVKDDNKLIELLDKTEGVVRHGNLTKPELYDLLSECAYMPYPCHFPEISCIAAIEAQAFGVLPIAPNLFALKETIKSPTLINAEYGTEEFDDEFLDVVELYQDDKAFLAASGNAIEAIRDNYGWTRIASEWNSFIDEWFNERFQNNKDKIFKQLAHNSDLITLSEVDPTFDQTLFDNVSNNNNISRYFPVANPAKKLSEYSLPRRLENVQSTIDEFVSDKKNLTVLEIGCYDGLILGHLYDRHKDKFDRVIWYDKIPQALDRADEIWNPDGTAPFEFIVDDVKNLASHNLQADIVIAAEIIEHVKDYPKLLKDIQSIVKPNGLVLFTTPAGPWENLYQTLNSKVNVFNGEHLNHFEPLDIINIFRNYISEGLFFMYNSSTMTTTYKQEPLDHLIYGFRAKKHLPLYELTHSEYMEKAIKTRPMQTVSFIMITKNEENNIMRCLNSVKTIADEIIVVDTGSTDATKELASRFTDKVYDYVWDDDFSAARNYSLDKATGDWVFFIDADEELYKPTELFRYLRTPYLKTYLIKQHQIYTENHRTDDQYPNRLFRNDGTHRFYGAIHELPKVSPIDGHHEACLYITDMEILHYGYIMGGQLVYNKLLRNRKMLMKDVKQTPDKIEFFLYLMRDFMAEFRLTGNPKYLFNADLMWRRAPPPDKLPNKHQKVIWCLSIESTCQEYRQLTMQINKTDFIVKKINNVKMIFINEQEYEDYKRTINEINSRDRNIYF